MYGSAYAKKNRHRNAACDRGRSLLWDLALVGAFALLAAPAWCGIVRRRRVKYPQAIRERAIDDSLKGTYPASDPPASRYVDIPANRR
ncbi:hypothetical protein ACG33_02255 [Steroidobacter denitrificans]|uniref:Uncharacterized protein n=1 Tax=Steroidobacter denitrificans TaxID=465721 RepID=A0A127F673_STEDE|nr:hypothetical protein [Steroidobacter denitrificans]AMN45952.1 hypothetical protein ACG33_02255 [Steroidobacter denitrificans]